MKKNLLIKLRAMLLNFEDIQTEEGVVLSVDGDLEVGKEVFTTDDNGDVVPAPDGEYNYENKVITVAEGVVTAIADKEAPVETPTEEETPAEEPVVEENEEEAPAAEETPAEEEDKDAKIAELQARIAELEAENAELKAKLEEPAEEPVDEQFKNQHTDEELTAQEKAANIVKFLKNRK